MQMKRFCINTNTYHGYSLDEALEGISATDIHQIELLSVKGWTEHIMPSMSEEQLKEIKIKIKQKGLIPVVFDGHADMMTKEGLSALYAGIKLAADFGCKWFVTELDHDCHEEDPGSYSQMIKHVENIAEKCTQYNLLLALETRGSTYNTGMKIKNFLDNISAKNVFINYDAANVIYFSGENPYSDLEGCVSKVGIVHLKDKAGASNEWNFPALGEGNLDLVRILNILPNNVIISVDIEFTEKGPKNVDEVHKALILSCDFLKKMGFLNKYNTSQDYT